MIDTSKMLVGLTMEIKMRWKDSRVMFANLNKNQKNPVQEEVIDKLWLPLDNIIHENAVIGKVYSDKIRRVFVIPLSDPILLSGFEIYTFFTFWNL